MSRMKSRPASAPPCRLARHRLVHLRVRSPDACGAYLPDATPSRQAAARSGNGLTRAPPAMLQGPHPLGACQHRTPNDRTRRHPLCPLADRLPPYRRRPHGAVQLALCARPRRQDAAADRGHRPRALHQGGDRRHPRRADLARHRMGRRHRLSVLPRRAPSRDRRAIARRRQGLSLLRHAGRTDANAREGARARAAPSSTTAAGATAILPMRRPA